MILFLLLNLKSFQFKHLLKLFREIFPLIRDTHLVPKVSNNFLIILTILVNRNSYYLIHNIKYLNSSEKKKI